MTNDMIISAQNIADHYAVLNRIGALGDHPGAGFHRPAYSDEETAVMIYFETQAKRAGLKARWDAVGNLFIETTDTQEQWMECGSHVDTVPDGGNFDGLAGVVAGFTAIAALHHKPRSHGLRLRIWRGEESASFGITSIGASAALGTLAASALDKRHAGRSLRQAMQEQGADPDIIASAQRTIEQDEIDQISAHLELHIEQGIVLEKKGVDIGIVTGIRAASRDWISLHGEFDHSGATPMGNEYRRDANLALAHILVNLDALFLSHQEEDCGLDLIQTIGHINSNAEKNSHDSELYSNAISKVSGYAYFSYELRSCNDILRNRYKQKAIRVIQETATAFGVSARIESISNSSAVKALDQSLQTDMQRICDTLGYSYSTLPSGAWHDAALMAQQSHSNQTPLPVGMIFIPCQHGKSHSPEEFASNEQIAKGTSLLATLMQQGLSK
ncbi:Zn-dependent hydrolase [Mariprofundus sp. EBB-1]|uniref:hydantoinase/carbamoylase family amidase n=1 Tax=Mariprofundus sp. EBB-1 TaxID=2650971 RepID=UPI000EF258C2|nr:hydantoinase/carbamoylase family amidase [Mariprofundus sp. EBB-1]RLL55916.1 Zn-dependent hydrolase [Mariprofundus sp. EBB-1]